MSVLSLGVTIAVCGNELSVHSGHCNGDIDLCGAGSHHIRMQSVLMQERTGLA